MRYLRRILALFVNFSGLLLVAAAVNGQTIHWQDLPASLQQGLQSKQIDEASFEKYLLSVQQQTATREQDGEFDHLIFFALQSKVFTDLPKIEPAQSAYEFVQSLKPDERERYLNEAQNYLPALSILPELVANRLRVFTKIVAHKRFDERLEYFQQFLEKTIPGKASILDRLTSEYFRAMKFLYRKEFLSRGIKNPTELAAYVASLYQTRGHSTDSQIEANFAIFDALAAIKAQHPEANIHDVLIVGPGMDFAPRTDLMDLFGPQSYQPFAVADALIGLKLCERQKLKIHCVDINDRVVDFLNSRQRQKKVFLSLLSGIAEKKDRPLSEEYKNYFRSFGRNIGAESKLSLPENWQSHLSKNIQLQPEILASISAEKLNIITQRCKINFDLVIVTNVFPYFNDVELSLALTNIAAMTRPGGYWLHNESRNLLNHLALLLDVPSLQSRTVLIAGSQNNSLFDGVAIHRKKNS
jgi:hypothetical protein